MHTDTDKFGHAVSVHQQGSCWQLGFAGLAPGGSAEPVRVDVKELKKGGTFGADGGGKFTHVFTDVTKATFVERGASGGLTAGRRIVTSFAADPSGELRLRHAPWRPTAALTCTQCRYLRGRVPSEPFLETYLKRPNPRSFFLHIRVSCCERFFDTKSVSATLPGAAQDAPRGAWGGVKVMLSGQTVRSCVA